MDGLRGRLVVAETAPELGLELFLNIGRNGIAAGLREGGKPPPDKAVVLPRQVEQETLEVGGNQDIHRRGGSGVKVPVAVVDAGADKIGQDVVAVGGADQPADRDSHPLGIVGGEDVAEVAGGDADVDGVAEGDLLLLDQGGIGRHIVDNLGDQPPPVDRVGGREHLPVLPEFRLDRRVGKDGLDPALGVVEVPFDRADRDVFPFLGDHLELLHPADAVLRVEHQHPGAGDVRKAGQRRLAGVTGSGNQDDHFGAGGFLIH